MVCQSSFLTITLHEVPKFIVFNKVHSNKVYKQNNFLNLIDIILSFSLLKRKLHKKFFMTE